MKRSVLFIFLFFLGLFIFARKDSTKLVNFRGFYVNTYYPSQIKSYYSQTGKYSDYYYSKFDLRSYQFHTPGIGFGYVLSRNALFIKTDFNYWSGTKKLDSDFYFNSEDENGKDPHTSFGSYYNYPSIGYQYYKINDHYSGTVNLQYFDVGFAITGNITRYLRLYSGWRINRLIKTTYNAKINRTASLYEVKRYNSQYDRVDSLIKTDNIQYKGDGVADKSVQTLSSYGFYNFGLNANFRIKKQLFFVDILFESNRITPIQEGVILNCLTFKLAYVFKYSNDLGTD